MGPLLVFAIDAFSAEFKFWFEVEAFYHSHGLSYAIDGDLSKERMFVKYAKRG